MIRFLFISILIFGVSLNPSFAQKKKKKSSRTKKLFARVFTEFEAAKYEDVIKTLTRIEAKVKGKSKRGKEIKGLIAYWKGMSYSRLNEYELAEKFLKQAIDQKYKSDDLYYEYGQVLYVSEKYKPAKVAFKKSVKKKYKMGVSLYYIAFISQELNDHKKAVSFYNMIEKLPEEDKKDVLQAARMQIGDIYLEKIEKQPDSFRSVEKYVIPQYKSALAWDPESNLATEIKSKIERLQRKYELILFKMRNGRPTARPPYYLRANFLYGIDDNATSISEDSKTSLTEKDYASHYYTLGAFGRYSFYPSSAFSYAPELSASMTKYNEDTDTIQALNTYFIKSALKMNYEHLYKDSPATFYIDLDYTYNAGYNTDDKAYEASDNVIGVTFSEELQFWKKHPSTFRFRYETKSAEESTESFNTIGFNYEQVVALSSTTLFWFNNFKINTYSDADTSNNNAFTTRLDAIFPTLYGLFNPTLYASLVSTNYVKDSTKGVQNLSTLGVNLNRPIGGKFYLTTDISMASQTADEESNTYKKQVITFNVDYVY